MKVAVTGASGFIGSAVVQALRDAGHQVLPFGRRRASALRTPMSDYQQWDIEYRTNPMVVDALVHCAACVGQWGDAERFRRTNEHGTSQALASVPAGARCVYLSTASVYPHARDAYPIPESATGSARPASAYARTKLAGEAVACDGGRDTVVLRPHIVYGPGDSTLWPRVAAACRGGTIRVPGTGANPVSVTHVHNLAHAVVCALQPETPSGTYNIADSVAPRVDDLLRTMFARHDLPVRIRYVPRAIAWAGATAIELFWLRARRMGDPPLTRFAVAGLADPCVLDITRARSLMGYSPQCTFRDGPL